MRHNIGLVELQRAIYLSARMMQIGSIKIRLRLLQAVFQILNYLFMARFSVLFNCTRSYLFSCCYK